MPTKTQIATAKKLAQAAEAKLDALREALVLTDNATVRNHVGASLTRLRAALADIERMKPTTGEDE